MGCRDGLLVVVSVYSDCGVSRALMLQVNGDYRHFCPANTFYTACSLAAAQYIVIGPICACVCVHVALLPR